MSDKKQKRDIEFKGRDTITLDLEDLQKLDPDAYAATSFGATKLPVKKDYEVKDKKNKILGSKRINKGK